jgi:hypothetical protein
MSGPNCAVNSSRGDYLLPQADHGHKDIRPPAGGPKVSRGSTPRRLHAASFR